jgi:hypothetical protein
MRLSLFAFCFFLQHASDMDLRQAHCLSLQAQDLDLLTKITKSKMFVMKEFICITKFLPQNPNSLQIKGTQQGKQTRV